MSVIDILVRVDAICTKFEKYDIEKQRDKNATSTDAFLALYSTMEEDVEAITQKASSISTEKNRAVVATLNAEVRRAKATLKADIPKLEKLAKKRVKGLTQEELESRPDLVLALIQKIECIPEGGRMSAKRPTKKAGGLPMEIRIDAASSADEFKAEDYQHSDESKAFKEEFERRKLKQDQGLEVISEGLDTLKNMAQDISEELDRQVPLVDEIDEKVTKVSKDITNTNARLKETVTKLRSSRNFCIDIILMCVILGIAGYLSSVLRKK